MRSSLADEIATVRTICHKLGLGPVAPAVLKTAHHTTLLLEPLDIVARVQSAEPIGSTQHRANREVAITRYLMGRNAPTVMPFGDLAGPHIHGSAVVTLWQHVPYGRVADETDGAESAAALVSLHRALLGYPGPLPSYADALDRCGRMLEDNATLALTRDDRHIVRTEFRRLRGIVDAETMAWTPLHGDAHPGNLLLVDHGAIWVDFEDVCYGPREYDIACLPADAWPRFADADQALIRTCSALKSACVAIWCAADPSRSDQIREAAAYHLDRIRETAGRP